MTDRRETVDERNDSVDFGGDPVFDIVWMPACQDGHKTYVDDYGFNVCRNCGKVVNELPN